MGTSSSSNKRYYLKKKEIDNICIKNPLFTSSKKYKNGDGIITIKDFKKLTNGLISNSMIKRIMLICETKQGKFIVDNLKYFYALLYTNNPEAKLNFLLDLIFMRNNRLTHEKYVKNVNKYFQNCKTLINLFLKEEFNSKQKIEREYIYQQIKTNYIIIINNFNFIESKNDFKENSIINNDESEGSILILNSNKKECNCINIKNINQRRISNTNKNKQFDKLEREFNLIERKNNGIFPITVFEEMLKYIYIIPSLVEIIGNFLRLKSQKTFFSFELFKELLEIITLPIQNSNIKFDDISKSLFDLLSYPKNYILTKSFSLFLKSTNPKISSKQINLIYKEQDIQDKITKNTFPELLKLVINDIENSFINMNYIQYIFFKGKCPTKQKEKECILLLLNGLTLDEYIKEKIKTEDNFYIINGDFWNKWNEYVNNPLSLKIDLKGLKIFNNQISDKNGKLNDDLIYGKDYIVLTSKLHELFSFWYGPIIGNDLKREKIYIDNEKNYKPPKNLPSLFYGEDTITKRKYEIELFPIFFLFYNFEQIKKNNSLEKMKEYLKETENNISGKGMYYPFSRKSKFFDLLKLLENSINSTLDIDKTRLWLYYKGRLEIIDFQKKLEEENINGNAIILLEINNGSWPSEKIKKDDNNTNNNMLVGLINIGNTCYLNSILQTFLNNIELRDILLRKNSESEFLQFLINKKNKGKLIKEFINLLKLKWTEGKKNITPNKFKQICGEYNENFQNYEQQDAYDFYTFLLESLHEDTNIKSNKIKLKNPDNNNLTEEELGNEYWANNIRNNASYFYSLYLGQLKSTLRCTICNKSKVSFEHFSSLSLPIPEGNKIILYIVLYRLPFTLKPYYNVNNKNFSSSSLRKSLQKIKINSIGIYADESDLSTASIGDNNKENNDFEYEQFNTLYVEKTRERNKIYNKKENMTSNALNINIPIKIRIEVERKEKCSKIIEILKSMDELELEKNSNYTYLIIVFNGNYINDSLQIDDCFLSYQSISVYEILNYNGIKKVFNYKDLDNIQTNPLEKEKIPMMINSTEIDSKNENELNNSLEIKKSNTKNNNNKTNNNSTISSENESIIDFKDESNEIIIPISHRFRKNKYTNDNLIENPSFETLITNPDFLLVTTNNSIKSYDLYGLIWEKFEYFFDSPSKYKNNLWWKGNIKTSNVKLNSGRNNNKNKPCSPFVLKILKKKTNSCSFCPWFKFCTGCILDPHNMNYLNFNIDDTIIVEWCREVINNEIHDKNKYLILNHHSINDNYDNNDDFNTKIPLIECLKLFTNEEELKDIQCENCKKKTIFKKSYQIERLPPYLVLVLKRFKYTKMYTKKIESLITFPIQELDLKQFYCNTKNFPLYDLYSVVNHTGNLSGGHYTCLVNYSNNWIKYDDSFIYENETNIETNSAYILFYKMRPYNQGDLYFNFMGLMDTAFKIYMKQNKFSNIFNYLFNENNEIINQYKKDCQFYYGEPVKINNDRGYLTNIFKKGNEFYCKVRLEKGYYEFNLKDNIKETIKVTNFDGADNNNTDNKKQIHKCASCYIF